MIDRYTLSKMGNIWSEKHKMEIMLKIEILACEAMCKLGAIPKKSMEKIKKKFDKFIDKFHFVERFTLRSDLTVEELKEKLKVILKDKVGILDGGLRFSDQFEGKIDDDKRVSSAQHIVVDTHNDTASVEDIEALLAQFGS